MIKTLVTGAVLLSLMTLSGCTRQGANPDAIVRQCQVEVAPAGTYQYTETSGLPVMVAVDDGTEAGAAVFNRCIRAKAAASGLIADPATSRGPACHKGAPTILGGATYCIGTI